MQFIQFKPKPVIVDTTKFEGNLEEHPCLKEMPDNYEIIEGELPKEYDTIIYQSPSESVNE